LLTSSYGAVVLLSDLQLIPAAFVIGQSN
jgi:hypothetical protein